MTIAEEVWVSTCELHRRNPHATDFSTEEIREAVNELFQDRRPGVQIHVSVHCVANKMANPADHRLLFEPSRGRRRLFRTGDSYDPSRRSGLMYPKAENLDDRYRELVWWYQNEYLAQHPRTERKGPSADDLAKLRTLIDFLEPQSLQQIGRSFLMSAIDALET